MSGEQIQAAIVLALLLVGIVAVICAVIADSREQAAHDKRMRKASERLMRDVARAIHGKPTNDQEVSR